MRKREEGKDDVGGVGGGSKRGREQDEWRRGERGRMRK